jgi:apolipoprotein N-acyltransferase
MIESSPSKPEAAASPLSILAMGRYALLGSFLMFASQPPLELSWLAWLAPLPWLWIATAPALPRRTHLVLWLAGAVYWMAVLHWIRLAHPATIVGGLFLSLYLGIYLPLWIAVVRIGVFRWSLPVWLVAPIAWVATEWLEAHVLGGLLMATPSHTQINWTPLVQIADLGGAYLVSLVILLVASGLCEILRLAITLGIPHRALRMTFATLIPLAAVLASLVYGYHRLDQLQSPSTPPVRVALVQGSHRAVWVHDPQRNFRVMRTYEGLTRDAAREAKERDEPLALIVWPESMHRGGLYDYPDDYEFPAETGMTVAEAEQMGPQMLRDLATETGTPLLVGIDRIVIRDQTRYDIYNSAAAVDRQGNLVGTYDKVHLVMFGEYVPLGDIWPVIYNYFPIGGLTPGEGPEAFEIEGVHYMPTICFETVLPHIVRGQVAQLTAAGKSPDVLVNITNDSWFDDSSELEMHLTCSRFRAIECRTPLVVAANGGLSASVDKFGRVLGKTQPMTEEVLVAEVTPGASPSLYARDGDWLAFSATLLGGGLLVSGFFPWRPKV